MVKRHVFATGRVACGIHESNWLPPGIYVDRGHTDPREAQSGLLYVSLESEPDKVFVCITSRHSPNITILDEGDAAYVRRLSAEQMANLPPAHVTLPSGMRLEPGRIAELVDLAARPVAAGRPQLTPRCEANEEGKAAIDRITRRFWHTMQHVLCPMDLDDRIEADTNALRAEFGLPELGRNDIIPDEEVSRCSMHTRGCSGCGWDHTDSPPAPSVDQS
jgi:hypothetical protein